MASAPENRGRQRSYTVGSISKERSRETPIPVRSKLWIGVALMCRH